MTTIKVPDRTNINKVSPSPRRRAAPAPQSVATQIKARIMHSTAGPTPAYRATAIMAGKNGMMNILPPIRACIAKLVAKARPVSTSAIK